MIYFCLDWILKCAFNCSNFKPSQLHKHSSNLQAKKLHDSLNVYSQNMKITYSENVWDLQFVKNWCNKFSIFYSIWFTFVVMICMVCNKTPSITSYFIFKGHTGQSCTYEQGTRETMRWVICTSFLVHNY